MRSTRKKLRQYQSPSLNSNLSTMTENNSFIFNTEQLEQSIKFDVESNILSNLLIYSKQLNDLIINDERLSKDYFKKIEKTITNIETNQLINDLINLTKPFFDKYFYSSIVLRCYIHLHVPTNESGNNQGVNIQIQILKEIQDMEIILQTNEHLFIDYYKKHYDLLKYINKYPLIEDFHLYLIEYERKIFDDIRSMILELRTIFLKTYDIIKKNLNQIQMPRNQLNVSMIN